MSKTITTLILAMLAILTGTAQSVFYVSNSTGDDSYPGTSWSQAFKTIQPALNAAATAAGTDGASEVWIAQGTYILTAQLAMKDRVSVYGGFVGNENLLSQRSTDPSLTILDGNHTNRIMYQTAAFKVPVIWSCFTIQNGYFQEATTTGAIGGGAAVIRANTTIENCIIKDNTANLNGGGVYIYGGGLLLNCVIEGNTIFRESNTRQLGGGVYINNNGGGTGKVESCIFKNNHSQTLESADSYSRGGGLYTNGGDAINCIFIDNTAHTGGGLYAYSSDQAGASNIINCKFYNNVAANRGGGIYTSTLSYEKTIYNTIVNCIVANNTSKNDHGGGIYATGRTDNTNTYANRIINTTIVRNTTEKIPTIEQPDTAYAGVYSSQGSFFMNSIIWGNEVTAATGKKQFFQKSYKYARFVNCAIQDLVDPDDFDGLDTAFTVRTGLISLTADNSTVAFKNPSAIAGKDGAGWETADWTITNASVCTNAGVLSYSDELDGTFAASAPILDINGVERGTSPSIGATEEVVVDGIRNVLNNHSIYIYGNDIITSTTGVIKVYNMSGLEVIRKRTFGKISVDLISGIYIVLLTDDFGNNTIQKIQVK